MSRNASVCGLASRSGFRGSGGPGGAGTKSSGIFSGAWAGAPQAPQRASALARAAATSPGPGRSKTSGSCRRRGGGRQPPRAWVLARTASHSASYSSSTGPSQGRSKTNSWRKSRRGRHLSSARNRVAVPSSWGTRAANLTWRCAENQCVGRSCLSSSSFAGEPRSLRATSSAKCFLRRRSRRTSPNCSTPRGQSWLIKASTAPRPRSARRKTSTSRTWYAERTASRASTASAVFSKWSHRWCLPL